MRFHMLHVITLAVAREFNHLSIIVATQSTPRYLAPCQPAFLMPHHIIISMLETRSS